MMLECINKQHPRLTEERRDPEKSQQSMYTMTKRDIETRRCDTDATPLLPAVHFNLTTAYNAGTVVAIITTAIGSANTTSVALSIQSLKPSSKSAHKS